MKDNALLTPLFKTIDRVLFGINDFSDEEQQSDYLQLDTEEEFDVERSTN